MQNINRFCRKELKNIFNFSHVDRVQFFRNLTLSANKKSSMMMNDKILHEIKISIPLLDESKHKGQAGRIGIIGGSKEYTGAPYFAAISALKVGCDLSHVFCASEASQVIKSYSPELIVHPILDKMNAYDEFLVWLPRLHSLVIGPGLGRDQNTFLLVKKLIMKAREEEKQVVIDADGLWLVTTEPDIVKDYSATVLTPNAMEFVRLYKKLAGEDLALSNITVDHVKWVAKSLGGVTIIAKGKIDIISDGKIAVKSDVEGSLRRCGGQGDLLSGSLGTFLHWMQSNSQENQTESNPDCDTLMKATVLASFAASCLTRRCSYLAFEKMNRHMTASDMIDQIPQAFSQLFSS